MIIDVGKVVFNTMPNKFVLEQVKEKAIEFIRASFEAYPTSKAQELINYTYNTKTSLKQLVIACIQHSTLEIINGRYKLYLNKNVRYNNIPLETVCALLVSGNMQINRTTLLQDAFKYASNSL